MYALYEGLLKQLSGNCHWDNFCSTQRDKFWWWQTGEPGGLPSMGSNRVGHDWSDLAAAAEAKLDLGLRKTSLMQILTAQSVTYAVTADLSPKKTSRWLINTFKNAQHCSLLEKYSQNYNQVLPHTGQNGHHQKVYRQPSSKPDSFTEGNEGVPKCWAHPNSSENTNNTFQRQVETICQLLAVMDYSWSRSFP